MIDILHPIPFSTSHSVKSIHAKKVSKNKMVSTRSYIFGYAIIFMLLNFVAYSLQDTERTMMPRNKFDEEETMSQQIEEPLNVVQVGSKVAVKGALVGGRKMAKMVNKKHTKVEERSSKKTSSSSSANPYNRDHTPQKRSKNIDHNNQVGVKASSTFMVINADYHVPRSHPPKNN